MRALLATVRGGEVLAGGHLEGILDNKGALLAHADRQTNASSSQANLI